MDKTLKTVGAVHTHTHTHTRHFLNKRENVALSCASFAMCACDVMFASVCFVALIDYS